jgi:MoaA/NifB/PqqE/SkfB family radical SAM enzyme
MRSTFQGVTYRTAEKSAIRDYANRKAKILGRLSSYARMSWHMWRGGVPALEILQTQFPNMAKEPRRPALVTLELTNHCDLSCPYCNSPLNLLPRGMMAKATFTKVLEGLKGLGMHRVRVVGSGEPTLHSEFASFIAELCQVTPFVSVLTNAQWRHPQKTIDAMLDAKVRVVEVSLNGDNKEGYEASRPGGRFERLVENLTMLKESKRLRRCRVMTNIRLMLRPSERALESRMIAFWRQYADSVMPQYIFALKRSAYRDDVYTPRQWEEGLYPRCSAPFKALNVLWNGDVPLCSFSVEQIGPPGLVIGNVMTDSLSDLWHGDVMRQYRQGHYRREPDKMPICKGCTACY